MGFTTTMHNKACHLPYSNGHIGGGAVTQPYAKSIALKTVPRPSRVLEVYQHCVTPFFALINFGYKVKSPKPERCS